MQFHKLSGPTHPLFACNTQWKCIGGLTPPNPTRCARTKWKAPYIQISKSDFLELTLIMVFCNYETLPFVNLSILQLKKKEIRKIILDHNIITTSKISDYAVCDVTNPKWQSQGSQQCQSQSNKLNFSKDHKIKNKRDSSLKFEMGIT